MKLLFMVALLCASIVAQNILPSTAHKEFEPGVTIPDAGTVFLVQHNNSHADLQRLQHSKVVFNRHVASNVAKANFAPLIAKLKASIDIKGAAAKSRVTDAHPTFYVYSPLRNEEEMKSDLPSQWELLRLLADNDHRVVAVVGFGRLTGSPSNEYKNIACKMERIDSEWVKITAAESLDSGDYALAQVPARKDLFADVVFDFAVQK